TCTPEANRRTRGTRTRCRSTTSPVSRSPNRTDALKPLGAPEPYGAPSPWSYLLSRARRITGPTRTTAPSRPRLSPRSNFAHTRGAQESPAAASVTAAPTSYGCKNRQRLLQQLRGPTSLLSRENRAP